VALNDDDPDAIEILLIYLYSKPAYDDLDALYMNLRFLEGLKHISAVLPVADKYDVPSLASKALYSLGEWISVSEWKSEGEFREGLQFMAKLCSALKHLRASRRTTSTTLTS
jgi:hypothetical protein